ncbi:ferredoxin [Alkalispirochaeta sphaeroplastigenens]|uniref:Ferredoxin n=2 Tax=Alkalispirochaeta TaxID=2024958 RepID=A0A1N6TKW1_9SPIO|nr:MULTISPECIES: ferredoxin [Alkalispirochaeta]POR01340.1 ferredoxin [Alkalispirochaeta sphaeroplastigenens]SIQ54040.1 ferredoxin [Alkalispirochaeta americana]
MTTKVDPDLCISCAICTNMVPDVFIMNDDGLAEAKPGDVPADLEDQVQEAMEECPADAIVIE